MEKLSPLWDGNNLIFICEGCGLEKKVSENGWAEELKKDEWEVFDAGKLCFCSKCRLNKMAKD